MKSYSKIAFILATILLGLIVAHPVHAASITYQFIPIDSYGIYWPETHSLNNSDQVTGPSMTAPGEINGYMWTMQSGPKSLNIYSPQTTATDINNQGYIVGSTIDSYGIEKGFIWSQSTGSQQLSSLIGPNGLSYATGINDQGQITGYSDTSDMARHAVMWDINGQMTDLGTLGGPFSFGRDINNNGSVVGESLTTDGQWHGFHFADGQMTDLGTLGGNRSQAYGVNDLEQIVGYSRLADGSDTNNSRAVIWDSNGNITDLGTFENGNESKAFSINNNSQVVGYSTAGDGLRHAFLWDRNDLIDLNYYLTPDSEWAFLETAFGINEQGHVLGIGYLKGEYEGQLGERKLFLMVPEPTTLTLLSFAALALIRKRKSHLKLSK